MTWTPRIPVAFPVALIEQANQLAQIIDPDSGGAKTFSPERTKHDANGAEYVFAEIPLKSSFEPIVTRRDPDEWHEVIGQLAESKSLDPIPAESIDQLAVSMLIGDECDLLERDTEQ